jgi:hypothetical protein
VDAPGRPPRSLPLKPGPADFAPFIDVDTRSHSAVEELYFTEAYNMKNVNYALLILETRCRGNYLNLGRIIHEELREMCRWHSIVRLAIFQQSIFMPSGVIIFIVDVGNFTCFSLY